MAALMMIQPLSEGDDMNDEILAYRKHKNLKLAANELDMPWQTLYVHLKSYGEPVTGDKLRYGTDRDKLGALAEAKFHELVPFARDNNSHKFQSSYDFDVLGQKVDVKASMPRQLSKNYAAKSWSFSFKKQTFVCDFMCCFCFDENRQVEHVLLIPHEFFNGLQTISVSCSGFSKWLDYSVQGNDLPEFFQSIKKAA